MFQLHRLAAVFLCLSVLILHAVPVRATVDEVFSLPFVDNGVVELPTLESALAPLRWNLEGFPDGRIPFVINPDHTTVTSSTNLPTVEEVRAAFRTALETWEEVPTATVAFAIEETGADPPLAQLDGVNLLTIADTEPIGPSILGATLIYALDQADVPVDVGPFTVQADFPSEIIEVDIALSPNVTFRTDGSSDSFDLLSVAVHEIGHALGRDHTGLIHTTMFATGERGATRQRVLSQDDIAGISNVYPAVEEFSSAFGSISGLVLRGGAPVFGAHVVALDSGGLPLVSGLTFPNGSFLIPGLPPGAYTLYVETIDGPSDPPEYDLGAVLDFSPAFNTTILAGTLSVQAGMQNEAVELQVDGDGSLNITGIAPVDPNRFLPVAVTGLLIDPGKSTTVQLTGRGLSGELQVSVSGSGVETVGEVVFFGGNTFDSASNSSAEVMLQVAEDAVAGPRTIFVEIEGQRAALSGGLIIRAQANGDGGEEPPVPGETPALLPGVETSASISAPNEEDVFTFSAQAGQFATISMLAAPTSLLDSFLQLEAPDGSVLDFNDDAIGLSSRIEDVRLPTDGAYRVIATGIAASVGDYTILLTLGESPSGVSTPVGSLSIGETVTNTLDPAGAVDVFTFEAQGGERVSIQVNGLNNFDPLVTLLDSSFERIARDDDSGPGANALIENVTLTTPGTHFIQIRGFRDTSGAYTLTLETAGAQSSSDDPFGVRLRLNQPIFRAGDTLTVSLSTVGAPRGGVDLYVIFVIPGGEFVSAIQPPGNFTSIVAPLQEDARVRSIPVDALAFNVPTVPAGKYTAVAAYVTAGGAPSLATIEALDVAFFQVE